MMPPNDGSERQDQLLRGKVHELLTHRRTDDPEKIKAKRARFLALLKSRYGYTNEKAVDEMERILKQFDQLNLSLGIHHPRSRS
jgi:hypothetical protein